MHHEDKILQLQFDKTIVNARTHLHVQVLTTYRHPVAQRFIMNTWIHYQYSFSGREVTRELI